jgi:hypothetical protein
MAFPNIGRLLREPILHFLLIGIALFVVYGKVAAPEQAGTRIVVSQAMVDDIVREHQMRWGRPPGDKELANLVDARVRDEILYRAGVAMGLDRDDPVIKRRVRQKLDVIAEEQNARDVPTDAELAIYLTQHADRFAQPATVSFEQIFFHGESSREQVEQAVASARSRLQRGVDPATLGQRSLLPPRVDNASLDLVARDFGARFAEQIETAPLNEWSGPLASGFGAHLVRVTGRTPASLPPLDSIRSLVAREWENERRVISRDESYAKLRSGYEVVIEAALPGAVKP